jgi:hypothetical protein
MSRRIPFESRRSANWWLPILASLCPGPWSSMHKGSKRMESGLLRPRLREALGSLVQGAHNSLSRLISAMALTLA